MYLYSKKGIGDAIYKDLQLNLLDAQRIPNNEPISIEKLLDLNPDCLLMLICPDANTRAYWLSLQHPSHLKKLIVIENGYMYLLPSNPWFEYSAIAINRMLDEIQLMLAGKNPNPFPKSVHGILPNTDL